MKSLKLSLAVVGMAVSAAAAPEISQLSVTQESQTRVVSVSYALNEPAIVTMEFFTNGVPINVHDVRNIDGTLNALVPAGSYTHHWIPYKDVPGGGKIADAQVKVTAWPTNSPPLYMAVDLTQQGGDIHFYPSAEALPYALTDDIWKTDRLLLRRIYATGVEWRMGASQTDGLAEATGEEAHLVTLTNDYYMGIYEFTQGQIKHVIGSTCGNFAEDLRCPANSMSPNALRGAMGAGGANDWPDKGHAVAANSYVGKLRALVDQRVEFDLPTEAQWEFAARAGSPYRFGTSADENTDSCTNVAWISWGGAGTGVNANGAAHPVGMLKPNAWGLYDTLGNVGEWVLNWRRSDVSKEAEIEPVGPQTGTTRMACGGGWYWHWKYARCSARLGWAADQGRNNHGFRICAPTLVK